MWEISLNWCFKIYTCFCGLLCNNLINIWFFWGRKRILAVYLYKIKQVKIRYTWLIPYSWSTLFWNRLERQIWRDKIIDIHNKVSGEIFNLTKLPTAHCTFNSSVKPRAKLLLIKAFLIQRDVTQEVCII